MPTYEFTTEDLEYLRHGDLGLKLRLYKPKGAGPFPAVIDLHGGAWGKGSLEECKARDEALAKSGLLVAALDFRDGNHGYPTALVDINYAIRWLKARAAQLNTRADLVGISGASSGAHLAMLAAMRPNDPRYTTAALPAGSPAVDATVRCVAMSWPVINPLSRYRNAVRGRAAGETWVGDIPERQGSFWKNDENMTDGNPTLMLERGEKVPLPARAVGAGPARPGARLPGSRVPRAAQRAGALRRELPQGRRRDRAALHRQRRPPERGVVRSDRGVLPEADAGEAVGSGDGEVDGRANSGSGKASR